MNNRFINNRFINGYLIEYDTPSCGKFQWLRQLRLLPPGCECYSTQLLSQWRYEQDTNTSRIEEFWLKLFIPRTTARAIHAHNMHCWIDAAMEKTVLADSTNFFHIPIDEKIAMKNPAPCKKDTHAAIRRWYQTFQEILMQHGVYVHPLWLFKKNHGGEWGFTIGDGRDNDIPTPLCMTCQQSSTLIFQLLSQSTMFPSGSPLHDAVANCFGNGLKALKEILQRSHPAFVDEPATLVTQYPNQREKSPLEHKMEAEDFLQMRSMVQGFSRELDDPNKLDIFINNMKHSAFVQRVTQDERRQRALLHKYQGDKLLETLNSVLMMPDCPGNEVVRAPRAVRQVSTPPRGATTGNRTSQIPQLRTRRGARINAVGAASPNSTDTSGSGKARSSGG